MAYPKQFPAAGHREVRLTAQDHDETIGPQNWDQLKPVYHDPEKIGCPRTTLAALAKHLPVFRRPDFIIGTATPAERTATGVIQIGYFSLFREAEALMRDAYAYVWVRDFDWLTWSETPEGAYLLEDPCALIEAERDDLARVVTVCMRSAHWGSEALEGYHQSGLLVRILERAAVLHANRVGRTLLIRDFQVGVRCSPPLDMELVRSLISPWQAAIDTMCDSYLKASAQKALYERYDGYEGILTSLLERDIAQQAAFDQRNI